MHGGKYGDQYISEDDSKNKSVKTLQLTSGMRNYHYKTKSSIIDIFTTTVVEIDVLTFKKYKIQN